MPDDDRRPRITRTTSVFGQRRPDAGRATGWPVAGPVREPRPGDRYNSSVGQGGGTVFFPSSNPEGNPLDDLPEGYEFVRMGRGGIYARRKDTPPATRPVPDRVEPPTPSSYYQQAVQRNLRGRIEADSTTSITAPTDDATIAQMLGNIDQTSTFLFDRGGPLAIDPETGEPSRMGGMQSRGVYGSADSLERQLPAGQTVKSGSNENTMTISAGVLWLRNLAARDRDAYNRLVVLLRNAGYGNLPNEDAALPLNGYTNQVGAAFALAANDLAQANLGGDNRTLLEYLTERGQGYADLLAQQEADAAAEAEYKPMERQYQDPAAVRAAAKAAAVEALGRALTDEEEARFEAAFRAKENALYDAIDSAGRNETAWSGFEPNLGAQADAFVDSPEFETEAAANRIGEYASSFMRMMGVGG